MVAVEVGVAPPEMVGEFDDVGRALAQGRKLQLHDVEPEQQVLAEPTLLDLLDQIAVRGRQHADVDPDGCRPADPVDHALLECTQELRLQPDIHLRYLVEEERAPGRFLELADPSRDRARERALLVPEQLGFEEGLRDRRAVDGHERLVAPGGSGMDMARHDLLAGPAFSRDEHGRIRARDLLDELDHLLHGGIPVDEGARIGCDRLQDGGDQLRVGRQRDVFLGAGLDGRDRRGRVRARAAGHHGRADPLRFERGHELAHRKRNLDHDEVRAAGAQNGETLGEAVRVADRDPAIHRDLRGGDELTAQSSHDEEAHSAVPWRGPASSPA